MARHPHPLRAGATVPSRDMSSGLIHHSDCPYWLDQYPHECECGLTRPARWNLRPWTQEEFKAWCAGGGVAA